MAYFKRLVVDLDDTISFTTNRDFENARPNVPLINKINRLYDEGWEIVIQTARGSLSCATRKKANSKYGIQIVTWLMKHNVKYTYLTFEKLLAAYYIDDKAITPEDFIELRIEKLHEGLSGSLVERHGNTVVKTFNDQNSALNAANAYAILRHAVSVPEVFSIVGKTIKREYVFGDTLLHTPSIPSKNVGFLIVSLASNKTTNHSEFITYVDRLMNHVNDPKNFGIFTTQDVGVIREGYFFNDYASKKISMCHGDFSLENIILNDQYITLIDPIYLPGVWSSYLLDLSKFYHSCQRHGREHVGDEVLTYVKNELSALNVEFNDAFFRYLVMSHWVRLLKYSTHHEDYESYVSYTKNLINEFSKLI
jgi:capsule biosynthesis phosphatase